MEIKRKDERVEEGRCPLYWEEDAEHALLGYKKVKVEEKIFRYQMV